MRHGTTKRRTVVNSEFYVCGNWFERFWIPEGLGHGNAGVKVIGSNERQLGSHSYIDTLPTTIRPSFLKQNELLADHLALLPGGEYMQNWWMFEDNSYTNFKLTSKHRQLLVPCPCVSWA
jgi:hypothetical protein